MVKVKICGIKRVEDALSAISLGADAVGLLVGQKHTSDDFLDKAAAKAIVSALPPFCSSVLVTHLSAANDIVELAAYIHVTTIQLHGDSAPEDALEIRAKLPHIKLYKAIHVIDESSIEDAKRYYESVDGVLLDTVNKATGQVGGTGKTHNWNISKRIVEEFGKPVILAGGLSPDNVVHAVTEVAPYGVDANSGTKGADGYKDFQKLKDFIERAKFPQLH